MNGDAGRDLLILVCMVFIHILRFVPPKVRLVVGSVFSALVAGTLVGFVFLTSREQDFDIVWEQAKVIVPILSIIFFLVIFFGWRHDQEQPGQQDLQEKQQQQERQDLQARFDLAKTLIEGHHYARARTVLGAINDPKAREWETKLRRRKPDDPDFLQQFQ